MELKLNRKIVVNVVGVVVVLVLVIGFYVTFAKPRMKAWREGRSELRNRHLRLRELEKLFGGQADPRKELRTLKREIANLKEANEALEKLKKGGVEVRDFPKELNDPDRAIKIELYRDYMKEVMEVAEDNIKEQLRNAEITPPDINLYGGLSNPEEAAYYMNRAGGLSGIINAMEKSQSEGSKIIFDSLELENFKKSKRRRKGAINIMSYVVNMTLDTESLMSFIYHLQEQDGYYFVDSVKAKPGRALRGAAKPLNVAARINTLIVFKSQEKKAVKAAAVKTSKSRKKRSGPRKMTGLMALAQGMKASVKQEQKERRERKWYQFWKYF